MMIVGCQDTCDYDGECIPVQADTYVDSLAYFMADCVLHEELVDRVPLVVAASWWKYDVGRTLIDEEDLYNALYEDRCPYAHMAHPEDNIYEIAARLWGDLVRGGWTELGSKNAKSPAVKRQISDAIEVASYRTDIEMMAKELLALLGAKVEE